MKKCTYDQSFDIRGSEFYQFDHAQVHSMSTQNPSPENQPTPKPQGDAVGLVSDRLVRPPEAWVRVIAPGLDVACKIDDQEAKEIIACALAIAERRTKKNENSPTPQQQGDASNPERQAGGTVTPTSQAPKSAVPPSA